MTRQKQTFFRKTFQRTKRFFQAALIGAALSFAVAGCGARTGLIDVPADAGVHDGARPDVIRVDTVKPKPDSGIDSSQKPDAYSPDSGIPPAYSYTVKNLIGDALNRELLDRDKGLKEYSLAASETSTNANPLSDGKGGNLIPVNYQMHRIDGTMFPPFITKPLQDSDSGNTYSEQQDLWVSGNSQYIGQYSDVVGVLHMMAYTMKFSNPTEDLGIPVCSKPTGTDYSVCDGYDRTDRHRLFVNFLGGDWVVTGMSPPAVPVDNELQLISGGQVKIAKEAISGIINVHNQFPNDVLTVDNLKFAYDGYDVDPSDPNKVWAVISVYDQNGVLLKKDKLLPGTTKGFSINGKNYLFRLWKIAPGYVFGANWIDASILAKELKLQHGFSVDPDNGLNKPWKVVLGWKNKGASASDTQPDHLRTIIIYTEDVASLSSSGSNILEVGDYVPLLLDPVAFKFSYNGLSATAYTTLRAELEKTGTSWGKMGGTSVYVVNGPYVRIKSSANNSFTYSNTAVADQFIIATSGATCNGVAFAPGSLIIKKSASSSDYFCVNYDITTPTFIGFPVAGDGTVDNMYGGIFGYAMWNNEPFDVSFGIVERPGMGASWNTMDALSFALKLSGSSSTFNFDAKLVGTTYWYKKDSTTYSNVAGPVIKCSSLPDNSCIFKEGFITERGSQFVQMTDTLVELKVANTLVYSQFVLTKK